MKNSITLYFARIYGIRWVLLIFILLLSLFSSSHIYPQTLDMETLKGINVRNIGPGGMSGRVTSIDVVLNKPSIIYVGTASGGLWKSTSGGIDWQPIFDKEGTLSIGSVKVYQKNSYIVWAGAGEGNPRNSQNGAKGIYRSIDAGQTWEKKGLENTFNIHRILINPDNENIIYVGAQGDAWSKSPDRGVYKTTDGGQTWKKILYVDENVGIADLVMDPNNPNKIYAAMWEYQRWPWFFKSGGSKSGLYITHNAGKDWKKLTPKEGMPEGEIGRIGIAVAKSNPNVVYALVESKKNALYRSINGGNTWEVRSYAESGKNVSNRPFYYSEIYVDPSNENKVYSLWSFMSLSEDGGKTFKQIFPYYNYIHPDHHAWWIHPDNPDFMIDGNDGGIAITRDQGKTWRFVENLPIAQFYHINVDHEVPYNVYGGMQDNGSWKGPAYVWRSGGIRNAYWEELFFGDGFDVAIDHSNTRYIYAMSQGGNLARIDALTGMPSFIRPITEDTAQSLRFNWNAAIAVDPFEPMTIYYGSQFVHKSIDRGETWQIISDDLTTNNTEQQQQENSGGLTLDVTGAENFTTILAIEPSPLEQGLLWAGTDDGNIYLKREKENWKDVTPKIKNLPKGSWVAQVKASKYYIGEAFCRCQ